jgi:CRP-like cAMP-binding protein
MNTTYNTGNAVELVCLKYGPLCEEARKAFAQMAVIKTFVKHSVLVKEGQHTDQLFFIISGSVRAYYLNEAKEVTDWFGFEHDFICSINGFYLARPSLVYQALFT